MDTAHVDDPNDQILRVPFRARSEWGFAFAGLALLVVLLLVVSFGVLTIVWLIGMLLAEANGMVTARRSARGLTLDADGITWHKTELFIPWPQVTELGVDTSMNGKGKPHLIVWTTEPAEALHGQRGLNAFQIKGCIQRFGGPMALDGDRLAIPPETVIARADRMRQVASAKDDLRPRDYPEQAQRARSRKVASIWSAAGWAGFCVALASIGLSYFV